MKTLGLALTMLLPHGVFAKQDVIKQSVQKDLVNAISLPNTQEERSDTFYVSSQETPHEQVITMQFDDIITLYGKEKGMEIIRQGFIQEINSLRNEQGLNALKGNSMLDSATQRHANYLHLHANEYDFTGNDQTKKSPHSEYDANGGTVNTPGKRAKQAGYMYSLISENISTVGALKPKAPGTIAHVLQEWINQDGHKKNIFSLTQDIGVGYADGLVVVVFAK